MQKMYEEELEKNSLLFSFMTTICTTKSQLRVRKRKIKSKKMKQKGWKKKIFTIDSLKKKKEKRNDEERPFPMVVFSRNLHLCEYTNTTPYRHRDTGEKAHLNEKYLFSLTHSNPHLITACCLLCVYF